MKQQDKAKTLDGLHGGGTATDGNDGLLYEVFGKRTKSGSWSWHRGFPWLPGFLGDLPILPANAQKPRRYLRNAPLSI